jgi:hypothetical protein
MDDVILKQILEVHFRTKAIFIFAEELGVGDFKTFIQPIRELRDAHEHIMRATASRLEFGKHPKEASYQNDSLRSALNHEIRAFYDCADWMSVLLRKSIRTTLHIYSPECIRAALPQYFSTQKPHIELICGEIAKKRTEKDGGSASLTCEEVDLYDGLLDELKNIYQEIIHASSSLEEYHFRERSRKEKQDQREISNKVTERNWSLVIKVLAGLIVALIITISGWIWTWFR